MRGIKCFLPAQTSEEQSQAIKYRHISVQLRHISVQLRHKPTVHTEARGLFGFPSPQNPVGVFILWLVKSMKRFLFMSKGTQISKQVPWLDMFTL